jgi:predicted nucleic acid-binding protein
VGNGGSDSSRKMEDTCPNPNTRQPKPERPNPSEELIQTQDKKKGEAEQCELNEEFRTDKKYGGFAYKLDKNDNPILKVNTKSGSEVLLTYDQVLQKYHHHDVYNLEPPKTFDAKEAKSLEPKDRIEYVQKNVPRDKVIEFQIANAKSLSNDNLLKVPGFVGHQKDQGNLYINTETGQVHFVNDRTNIWRTTVIKTRTGLQTLAQNGFHLFPNAGK